MNPYGITQVDIPGVLGVYQSARRNRLNELSELREQKRKDAEFERKTKTSGVLAEIAKSMQPKGGGQSSQSVPPDTSANPQPGAAPEPRSMDDMMGELAALDFDTWAKVDDRQKEQIKQATSYLANAAMDVSRLKTDAEKAAAWARYVQQAEAGGMDIPTHLERYSPEALNQAVASAGFMEKLISRFEPDYRVVPQGGYLENVNPYSRSAPLETGQSNAGPAPGTVVDGYRFRGGDPNNPQSWEAEGGPTPGASGGF